MASPNEWDNEAIALAPLRWNLVKIERGWEGRIALLDKDAEEETNKLEATHREQRRALVQRLKATREAAKSTIPLNCRLQTMRDSRDNLQHLGRGEEAEKVRRKLEPLERAFWSKAMAETGIMARAKRERDALLTRQQDELGSLRRKLVRGTESARNARDAEIKTQKRSTRCSSDDIWSIWFAAKTGESSRLSKILASPGARVDQRDLDSGWTALHFAARQGRLRAVEILLGRNASVGAKAPDGKTALHFAAGWGTYEVCLALLHAGADKNIVDRDESTPLQLAESKRQDKIAPVLKKWRPIGLTATQTQGIIESRGEGPPRPWELEKDLGIRAQLRVLDMKRERFGDKHRGARTTLGKLADMCRSAGRLEDSQQHLEQLLQLLHSSKKGNTTTTPPRDLVDLAVVLGNLGVLCHEIGDDDRAREMLERSLEIITSGGTGSEQMGSLVEASTRNLALHYLSEGRVEEARLLFRKYLEFRDNELRSDMPGGDDSVELIKPLELLSYADMLAGDHVAAAVGAERARSIADARRKYANSFAYQDSTISPSTATAEEEYRLTDPVSRLEWLGLQRFRAGKLAESVEFFSRGRSLIVQREKHSREMLNTLQGKKDVRCVDFFDQGVADEGCRQATVDILEGAPVKKGVGEGEFHPEAMRLDRCTAVAICRQGPDAF